MQIPDPPLEIYDLDLMKRLAAYGQGTATWRPDGVMPGADAQGECRRLHTDLGKLAKTISPLLDRVMSREMERFTMHDHKHALKVAHLMWHIVAPRHRERLTPPEIGLAVAAAYLHDVGMFLSPAARAARLGPDSDLWDRLELDAAVKATIEKLKTTASDPAAGQAQRDGARRRLQDAEEALLCQDTRERHALPERYQEILAELREVYPKDKANTVDIDAAMSFGGDRFLDELIDICISHNEDAESLVRRKASDHDRPRFATDLPLGVSQANLHFVAAALRLADILDFDRERTPPVLFHYLLPGPLELSENRSALEWSKHLAISNWHIDTDAVVFRGRCHHHVVHHAIVQFGQQIGEEIQATRQTFASLDKSDEAWPFLLPTVVETQIDAVGYQYVPYRFELDDARIYQLLMGGAIYTDPLAAVRELIQNAVDACVVRDQQTRLYTPEFEPSTKNRIWLEYHEPTPASPFAKLVVEDTGVGMDALVIERYFLKVGRSYYNSADFNRLRVELRKKDLDFAPISEFGIGFLSCFLLADRVEIDTAMVDSPRSDFKRRQLEIHGPTRLIKLTVSENAAPAKRRGTRVTLTLVRGRKEGDAVRAPSWEEIETYIRSVCVDLPYALQLKHVAAGGSSTSALAPRGISTDDMNPPSWLCTPDEAKKFSEVLEVSDSHRGVFEGEIRLLNSFQIDKAREQTRGIFKDVGTDEGTGYRGVEILRGGFVVGRLSMRSPSVIRGRIRLRWQAQGDQRYLRPNLAREVIDASELEDPLAVEILKSLALRIDHIADGLVAGLELIGYHDSVRDRVAVASRFVEGIPPTAVYALARNGWLALDDVAAHLTAWEASEDVMLPLPQDRDDLDFQLLCLLFPHQLTVHEERGVMLASPPRGWQNRLQTAASRPVLGRYQFADYEEGLRDAIYCSSGRWFLNRLWQAQLEEMFPSATEIDRVLAICQSLSTNPSRLALPEVHVELLQRAQAIVGDLQVVGPKGRWKLTEFLVR